MRLLGCRSFGSGWLNHCRSCLFLLDFAAIYTVEVRIYYKRSHLFIGFMLLRLYEFCHSQEQPVISSSKLARTLYK